jgi:hypothetical protein
VSGTSGGNPFTSYTYTTGNAVSNLGHAVQYLFTWGDGTTSGWLAPGVTSAGHTWTVPNSYQVTVQAHCATDTLVTSAASPPMTVTITQPQPPSLRISSAHTGNFLLAQTGAAYTLTVSNAGSGPTNGATVAASESVPAGLIPKSITGTRWSCTQPAGPCTRTDVLAAGASYPAITVTVDVPANAPANVTNQAAVSGGGSANASASDATTIDALPRYANPLAFGTSASVVAGVPTIFTVTYTSDNGPGDIASGQVKIDNCYLSWDSSGNIRLYGAPNG